MNCIECGLERVLCLFCDDFDDTEDTELTAADEAAYERYKERCDFDYWHRFD